MKQLYKVKVSVGLEYESIADEEQGISVGQQVIIKCEKYLDFAVVIAQVGEPIADFALFERKRAQQNKGRHVEGQGIPQIIRVATCEDCRQASDNDRDAFEAHNQTMERIKAHNLEMKLIHTHYAFDRKLIIFQFSADGRIDFRELLRDLTGLLKVRVELRQVGVRDEASILGGVGTCGRPFCCASFLPSFNSINVKMAKQQGLSLNPLNISGCCGRLKCCLQYEADVYRELNVEMKRKQATEGAQAVEPADDTAAEASDALSEDMFEGEGTIVTPQRTRVAAAEDGTTGNVQGITRQQHQERRRERQQAQRNGLKESSQGNREPRKNRPQQNPQKRPLPPAGGEETVGSFGEDLSERAERNGHGGHRGNGSGERGNGERVRRERGERRREHGQGVNDSRGNRIGGDQRRQDVRGHDGGHGASGRSDVPCESPQPSGGIGEFGG